MEVEERQVSGNWMSRHEVVLYLVLAYAISWTIWPLVLFNPDSSPLVPFGPGLAAVLVAVVAGGVPGLVGLLRQLGRWRIGARWYGVAVALPAAFSAAALGAAVAAGAPLPRWEPSDLLQVTGTLLVTMVLVGLFEELGWRGFLLPRLQRGRGALAAALMVGLAWLPWHLPELVSDPGQRPLAQFAIFIFALSVLLAWLYNSTGASLPVVILLHAAFNSFALFFLSDLEGNPKLVAWWSLAGLSALAAVVVVRYAGARSLTRYGAAVVAGPAAGDTGRGA